MSSTGKCSQYLTNKLLDHTFGGSAYVQPITGYVALFNTSPGSDDSGAIEPSGTGYARVAKTLSSLFATSVARAKTSNATTTFPTPGASWGSAVGVGIYDALTGGNLLWSWTLNAAVPISSGDPVTVNSGDMVLTII